MFQNPDIVGIGVLPSIVYGVVPYGTTALIASGFIISLLILRLQMKGFKDSL